MLACQITGLACLWLRWITWVVFSTVGGIEVTHGRGAVAISWDRKAVYVVGYVIVSSGHKVLDFGIYRKDQMPYCLERRLD